MTATAQMANSGQSDSRAIEVPSMESSARDEFVAAMGQAATGVTVVTTANGSERLGVTVSAMSSVSADPPLVLVCVHQHSPVCDAIERNGVFCVNVLSDDQRQISDVFAGRVKTETGDRFACGAWLWRATGAPVLVGAAAHFDCQLEASHEHGSHRVFVGRVVDAKAGRGAPLVYCDRSYGRVATN